MRTQGIYIAVLVFGQLEGIVFTRTVGHNTIPLKHTLDIFWTAASIRKASCPSKESCWFVSLPTIPLLIPCFKAAFLCFSVSASHLMVATLCWAKFTFALQSRHHAGSGFEQALHHVATASITIDHMENLGTESAFPSEMCYNKTAK